LLLKLTDPLLMLLLLSLLVVALMVGMARAQNLIGSAAGAAVAASSHRSCPVQFEFKGPKGAIKIPVDQLGPLKPSMKHNVLPQLSSELQTK